MFQTFESGTMHNLQNQFLFLFLKLPIVFFKGMFDLLFFFFQNHFPNSFLDVRDYLDEKSLTVLPLTSDKLQISEWIKNQTENSLSSDMYSIESSPPAQELILKFVKTHVEKNLTSIGRLR